MNQPSLHPSPRHVRLSAPLARMLIPCAAAEKTTDLQQQQNRAAQLSPRHLYISFLISERLILPSDVCCLRLC